MLTLFMTRQRADRSNCFREKTINTVLSALKESLELRPQSTTELHINWRLLTARWAKTLVAHSKMSSAYAMILKSKLKESRNRDSRRMFQRKGDKMLPWGQPTSRVVQSSSSSDEIVAVRSRRKASMSFVRYLGQSLQMSPRKIIGCHAASKALFISKKAHATVFLAFQLHSIWLTRSVTAVSVDLPSRKPCWLWLNHWLSTANFFSLVWRILSKSLDRLFRMLIGRKLLTVS